MALDSEQKQKIKKLLFAVSSDDERSQLTNEEKLNALADKVDAIVRVIASQDQKMEQGLASTSQKFEDGLVTATTALATLIEKYKATSNKHLQGLAEMFSEYNDSLISKLDEVKNSDGGWNKNAAPLFRQMIAEISGVKEYGKKNFEKTWNFPQYSSVSVRDRNFSNINPKTDGIGIGSYDYVSLSQASLTDTYTFRIGGASGTLVATIVITYTTSAKTTISTVVKTPITTQ